MDKNQKKCYSTREMLRRHQYPHIVHHRLVGRSLISLQLSRSKSGLLKGPFTSQEALDAGIAKLKKKAPVARVLGCKRILTREVFDKARSVRDQRPGQQRINNLIAKHIKA
jgi:hypothetical protein